METADLFWREKLHVVAQIAQAGLAWLRHDTRYPSPVPDNPKFMSAFDAARLIHDGDVLAASGLGAHQRASILYWAIRERFDASGHPSRLTVINVGGHGGRGMAPGTLEELGRAGLCTRFITSHFETFHAMLALAEAERCELQCLPLGVITLLFDALGRGRRTVSSRTGVGTFLDPRTGRGSPLARAAEQLVQADGRRLRYRIPAIDVALFNAPAADRYGNIYISDCAVLGESGELVRAARRNGGRVLVNVGRLIEPARGSVFLTARQVDAIVYHPDTEQTGGVFHRDPWKALTTGSKEPIALGLARLRFVNRMAPVLRRRSESDAVLVRLAAATLVAVSPEGAMVSIGTGLPEEIPTVIFENGRLQHFRFMVETGVGGGLPASGLYFGAALRPSEILPSVELFKRCAERLDATCLGALEIDRHGNVNVSRRGPALRDYVGPGGFMDFATHAQTIVFVCSWMRGGEILVDGDGLRIVRHGLPKLVDQVEEITFAAAGARRRGQRVLYVTHAGVFELGRGGLTLRCSMPGIDLKRDVVDFAPARFELAVSNRTATVPRSVVSGTRGFLSALRPLLRNPLTRR